MNDRQRRFADEYLIDLNAARAYKAVYPSARTDATACANASRLLRNAKLREYIDQQINLRGERMEITQDMVVRELWGIALAEASDETTSKLKFANKLKALELLGRHLGMFRDRVAVDMSVPPEVQKAVEDFVIHGSGRT